jgi:hypothetical protein
MDSGDAQPAPSEIPAAPERNLPGGTDIVNTDKAPASTDAVRRRNRSALLLIFAISFVSLGASYLLFYMARDSGVWGTTNNGVFVDPPRNISDLALTVDGMPWLESDKWWLFVNVGAVCDAECERALHQLRQLHVLLNKEANRVERALLTDGSFPVSDYLAAYPGLVHMVAPVGALEQGIFIVDPLGNLVFYYPLEDAGKPVLDDLKRLLKLSQIG